MSAAKIRAALEVQALRLNERAHEEMGAGRHHTATNTMRAANAMQRFAEVADDADLESFRQLMVDAQ